MFENCWDKITRRLEFEHDRGPRSMDNTNKLTLKNEYRERVEELKVVS